MTRIWLAMCITGIAVVWAPALVIRFGDRESFRGPLVVYGVGMVLLFAGAVGLTVTG